MTNLKTINSRIANIATQLAGANEYIQATAIMIVEHAMEHGDAMAAFHLYQALPGNLRRNYLLNYFKAVSPIAIKDGKDDKPGKGYFRKPDSKDYNPFNLDLAKAIQWHKCDGKKESEVKIVDLDSLKLDYQDFVIKLAKKAAKALPKGSDERLEIALRLRAAMAAFDVRPNVAMNEAEVKEPEVKVITLAAAA